MRGGERQRLILERARAQGAVDVRGLAEELAVSPETVRRDLRVLEAHGVLRRTRGGAYPLQPRAHETSPDPRTRALVPEKRRIAAAAAGLLGPAETVFVDEGSTAELVAEALPGGRPLTVLTPALGAARRLSGRENVTVLLLGGQVRGSTRSTAGPWVDRMLSGFVVDLAYLSAAGISLEHGVTTQDPGVARTKARVMRMSRRQVLCVAHTGFGAVSFHRFAAPGEFDAIVTDSGLPASRARSFTRAGYRVLRV
ncbi:DeoR family transcriptional regulator [Streptomyces sp. SID486]|uniref:DeoR family transcriptional regulator n=1 Tax=Streptomyces sp. SID486 TaxID=2690264 RepID=UPI00136F6F51|nr:DeoR family transcriptional regulator [Streptomyces sp. SID486]